MKNVLILFPITVALVTACGGSPAPVNPAPTTSRAFVATADALYSIVLSGPGTDTRIGALNVSGTVTDIAWDGSALYGVTERSLVRINAENGLTTTIGDLGSSSINALTVDTKGTLYGAGFDGNLFKIDKITGAATGIGNTGYAFSGDLVSSANGTLYGTVLSGSSDTLVTVNPATAQAAVIGPVGYSNVYGLTFQNGTMYGLTNSGTLLSIDVTTGRGSKIRDTTLAINGMQ